MEVRTRGIRIDTTRLPQIEVAGFLDFTNAGELKSCVRDALRSGVDNITIDLSEAEILDCSAVSTLVQCSKLAADCGCSLTIASASPQILRALQLCGFAADFGLPVLRLEGARTLEQKPKMRGMDWNIAESVALSEPEMIKPLMEVAVDAAREAGFTEQHIADVQLAVGEAVANAVRHGSPKGGENRIRIRCLSCKCAMVVEVTDEGEEFDFDGMLTEASEAEQQERMGLYLLSRAMDEVECSHTGDGNRLRMIKWMHDE